MTLVLNHSQATGRAKLVLMGIANHQGDQGAWPSIETLARYANASERSVMRDIQELEAMGELIVERNAAPIRGQYRPNLYWVNVSAGVTDLMSGVTNEHPEVTDEVGRGDTVVTLNVLNPNKKLKETLVHEFNQFWAVYPRKQAKGEARRAFAKAVAHTDVDTIIKGAIRYADDPNRSPSFTAMPATWLNQERWEDGPLPERILTKQELEMKEQQDREARRERELAERERLAIERERERIEAEEARKRVEFCEHEHVKVMCKKCL